MQKGKIKIKQSNALKGFLFRAAQPSGMTIKKYVILNLIQDLRRLSCLLRNSIRGRFQIKFGMTPLFNKEAFTLIELLVVVLIIAILAAIALPQYQKAVDKSGFVQIWNTAKALGQAQEVYYLDHGHYANSLRALDVNVAKYANRIVLQSCSNSNLPNSAYIYHPKLPNVFLLWGYQRQCSATKGWSNEKACYARKNDKRGNALCAAMTGKPVRTLAANGNCNAGVHCCYFF